MVEALGEDFHVEAAAASVSLGQSLPPSLPPSMHVVVLAAVMVMVGSGL